jgi:CHASE3 domain sensor protein
VDRLSGLFQYSFKNKLSTRNLAEVLIERIIVTAAAATTTIIIIIIIIIIVVVVVVVVVFAV